MEKIIVDTTKLNESGKDIIQLTKELNETFESLFSRIFNMNTKTFEWVGAGSEEFVRRTMLEKNQYIKTIDILKKYGEELVLIATSYETIANKEK